MKTSSLPCIKPNAAGIDIGSRSHFVAVPSDRDVENVKEFGFFTENLHELCQWLKKCNIDTVAVEAMVVIGRIIGLVVFCYVIKLIKL